MARIRNIKPEFFTSESVSALPLRARLTWIGLWTQCDEHGRTRDNVKLIKAAVWPLDNVSLRDIEEDLEVLAAHGRIARYWADGKHYLAVANWGEHQYGAFKNKPKYPAPPENAGQYHPDPTAGTGLNGTTGTAPVDNQVTATENHAPPAEHTNENDLLDESGIALDKFRDDPEKSTGIQVVDGGIQGGGTREAATPRARPPDRCPRHRDHPDPPACRACATARETAETWDTQRARAALEADRANKRAAADARALATAACDLCDEQGYRGRARCTHDPDAADRAARGREAVNAALRKDQPA